MKKKWKGALVGGIVGFVAPWLLFIFAVAKGAPEIGFALQPVIILSLLMLMTGILIGYVIGSGKKKAMIIALGGFFIPWLYFIYRYLNYISL
ncbi:MAG: hypothetical protein KJ858_05485, partial [Nanoarchaeota archaeon]|nr:hypothetical protein [Nanoarchaeota archaeon]